MVRSDRDIVTRLGPGGMSRVLDDVLDQPRLIRLANAVGLSYPGMRTQSQKRPKLIADLIDRAGRDEAAGRAVIRLLRKETAAAAKEWAALAAEARSARLDDPSLAATSPSITSTHVWRDDHWAVECAGWQPYRVIYF